MAISFGKKRGETFRCSRVSELPGVSCMREMCLRSSAVRQRPKVHGGIRIASCPGQCPARTCNRRYLGPAMSWPGRVRREREAWRDRRYFVARSKAMQAVTPCFLRRTCAVVQAILKKYSIYTSYAMHCTTAQLESNLRVVLGTCSLVLHFWPFWPVLGPTTTCEISKSPHSEKPRLGTLKPPTVG